MQVRYVIPDEARRRIPLYVSGLGAATVGTASLSTAVGDRRFASLVFALLVVGFATSWGMRAGLVRKHLLERGILVVLSGLLLGIVLMRDLRYEFLPPTAFSGMDSAMTSALAWLMVIYSFTLYTDKAVIFMCVPALSLIGLVGTFGPNTEILMYFVMFVCFACFALMEQNALIAVDSDAAGTNDVSYRIGLTAGIAVAALTVGLVTGQILLHTIGGRVTAVFVGTGGEVGPELQVQGDFMPVCTGPVALSDMEVLTVNSPEPLLWRGQVFDTYTGRGWTNTTWEWDPVPQPVTRWFSTDSKSKAPQILVGHAIKWDAFRLGKRASVKYVKQTFRTRNTSMTMVFGAAEPEFIAFHKPQQIIYSAGAFRTKRPYGPAEPYTVLSAVSTASPQDLALAGNEYPEFIVGKYLRVPPACWQVERLTQQAVGDKSNPYDKVLAIKKFLESHYVYDTAAPGAPQTEDAITYFLLKSRRGYCDVFASAMAIMCRQAGVPARVVTGYATGEYDRKDGLYHVRQRDRHAWAEVYFPNYGWIAFDLSPQAAGPGALAGLRKIITDIYGAVVNSTPGAVALALLVLLGIYLLKAGLAPRASRQTLWESTRGPGISRAVRNYRKMCDLLARLGYPRSVSVTPLEYIAQVTPILPANLQSAQETLEAVTLDFIEARYALRELPDARITKTKDQLEEFARAIRRLSRAERRTIREKRNTHAR